MRKHLIPAPHLSMSLGSLLRQRLHPTGSSNRIRRPSRALFPTYPSFRAPTTSTLPLFTRASSRITPTLTRSLLRTRHILHRLRILLHTTTTLSALHIRQTSRLSMDVTNLLIRLRVEIRELLPSGRPYSFLIIRVEATPDAIGLVRHAIRLIESLRFISRFVSSVEVCEGIGEAAGDAVLVVQGDGALKGGVAEDVAVGEILGYDPGSGLVFLRDVMAFAGFFFVVGACELGDAGCAGDGDLGGAELGVVEEEGGFCGARRRLACADSGEEGMGAHVSFSKVTVAL